MRRSIKTVLVSILLAIALTVILGWLWPSDLNSREVMSRTEAELDSVVLERQYRLLPV